MKHAFHSVVSALMLALACAVAAATVLVVATALAVAVKAGGAWSVVAGISVVGLLAAMGVGLFVRRRRWKRRWGAGVSISIDEQPQFWVEIYRIAEGLGIRTPDELLLFPDTNVAVAGRRTWIGLRPGVRRVHLGLPLLAGLTERELRAVVAHELFGRWGPRSFARVIYRGREVVGRVADAVGEDSVIGKIVGLCSRMYVAASFPITRGHELKADRLSADLAGKNATASALGEVAVLGKAWAAFVAGYAEPAAAAGRRSEDLFAGFTRFVDETGQRTQLAEPTGGRGSHRRSACDSQLSLGDRLAAIASLPEDDMHDTSGPALGMMRNPDQLIRRVEESMFHESGTLPATWEDIMPEAGVAAARADALQLQRLAQAGGLGSTLSIATLMELMSLGLVDEMVRPMSTEGASPEVERQLAVRLVTGFLATAAVTSGTASYRFSWDAPRQLVDDKGVVDDLPLLVDAALADGLAVSALELWLTAHRVGHEFELGIDPGQPVPAALAADGLNEEPLEDPRPSLGPVSETVSI